MKNLRKKYEYLKSMLGEDDGNRSETEESEEDSDEEEVKMPIKDRK